MNARQLAFFRRYLERLRADLLEHVLSARTILEADEAPPDPNDRATMEEGRLIELRPASTASANTSKKIDTALVRIADGTYGYCEETAEPIGLKRLLARPTTTLSLEAQERHERAERLGG